MANKNYISGSLVQTPPTFTAVTTGSDEYSVEFNDANASGLYWQGSRYLGNQLFTTEINSVTTTTFDKSGSVAGVKYVGQIVNGVTSSISIPDKTGYGNTPCIQKYSRNIYFGNSIIGMDNGGEDKRILNFPEFSYLTTNTFYTINYDDTISITKLDNKDLKTFSDRYGFYRKFYEDFPMQSKCSIIVNDTSIKTNLKDNYNIYFNQGQLHKLARIAPPDTHKNEGYSLGGIVQEDASIMAPFYNFCFITGGIALLDFSDVTGIGTSSFGMSFSLLQGKPTGGVIEEYNIDAVFPSDITIYNKTIYNDMGYTGSFEDTYPTIELKDGTILSHGSNKLIARLLRHATLERKNTSYKGNQRYFVTFCESGSDTPIRTIKTGSYPNGDTPYITNNLAELSTSELDSGFYSTLGSGPIIPVDIAGSIGVGGDVNDPKNILFREANNPPRSKFKFNFNYTTGFDADYEDVLSYSGATQLLGGLLINLAGVNGEEASPPIFKRGRVFISRCDDANPSLLVNLTKELHLPDGIGQNGFIILPENIHPHIKQNLTHYLAQAGIPLGVDKIPIMDNEFRKLK